VAPKIVFPVEASPKIWLY